MSTTASAWTSWSRPGKQLTRVAAGLVAFALASSVLATPVRLPAPSVRAGHAAPRARIQVVVVALDGVRHQDVFGGVDANLARKYGLPAERVVSGAQLMPHLHELIARGAALGAPGAGFPISASGPDYVSLPGYSEILTGSTASGCSTTPAAARVCRASPTSSLRRAMAAGTRRSSALGRTSPRWQRRARGWPSRAAATLGRREAGSLARRPLAPL